MAEILLTFAVEQILEKVSSTAIQEIAGPWRLNKDLQNLRDLTQRIHAKVQEARNNQAETGQAVKPLLVKLQDVLYYAEDVLDEFSYEILRRQAIQRQPMLRLCAFASPNNPILFRLKMASKVKKINMSLDDTEKLALRDFALTGKVVTDPVVVSSDQLDRVTVSYFDKSEPPVIGRESEVEAIVKILLASSSTPSLLNVVSIVGFGGLGKTSLAKMVLHQVKETTKLFDETLWVCVSEPFDIKKILKGMLETLNENAGGLDSVEAILRHLESKLKDKKFLMVLDDVWEDNNIKCNILKTHLLSICSRPGNFVIVTTRKLGVAKAMDPQKEHVVQLKGLEDKECWEIIKKKCVMQWAGAMPKELEEIGVEVGIKCKGVPLAAKVVGGTLCKKKTREEWLSIQNSVAWDQIDEENQMFPILKLSFHQLHPSLKQCFVYCSLFPKDFEYKKEELIELWMAEGFLNRTSTTNKGSSEKSMEAVGDEFFNGLIVHSFFQDVKVDEFDNVIGCKMHDLLHDVATSVSNYKMLKWKDESTFFVRTSNHKHDPTAQELERGGAGMVRSVICQDVGEVSNLFPTLKRLRSLDISDASFKEQPRIVGRLRYIHIDMSFITAMKELPSIIGKLKHLRYLNISENPYIKELPKSITKLYNLQTIRLIRCRGIRKLPTNMINLVRLRHIHFDNPHLTIYNVGQLYELRTLPLFVAREEDGFRIEELNKLNELRGVLQIYSLQFVRDKEEAKKANLKEKKNIIELSLEWGYSIDSKHNDEIVLEGLLPPSNIKNLRIRYYRGEKFPNWLSIGINNSQSQLTQLVKLSLLHCVKCEIIPSLGHLPRLKTLHVEGLDNIRIIGSEFYGECQGEVTLFPQLKEIILRNMKKLQEWGVVEAIADNKEKSVAVFPLLEKLSIESCPRLRSIPLRHLSSLVSLLMESCEDMEYLSNDIQNLPSLDCLRIKDCRNLVSLSNLQHLKSLKELSIEGCFGLTSLSRGLVSLETLVMESCGDLSVDAFCGLSSLKCLSLFKVRMKSIPNVERPNSLEELNVCVCPELTSVSVWLKLCTSLRELDISSCEKLISIDDDIISSLTQLKELVLGTFSEELENFPGLNSIHLLSSLEKLQIVGWPKLKSLPQNLQHLTSLKYLSVWNFNGVENLPDWLGNLSSLQHLELGDCRNLKYLPTTINRLTDLTALYFSGCPLLKQRYNQDTGPDRHLISHIANISIY